jgi:alkanesulfonate monooxygenase SsuD/methylene tetrahydromethanopterin reductase-like flavin-dependent oxidoreductase (luciferase family)
MAAAAVTRRLRFGTGICLVVERDPIVTAKEVATLEAMAAAGVARAIFGLPSESREAVLPRLDAYSAVIRSMRERRISLARGVWRRVGGPRPAGSRFLFRGRGVGCLVG